MRPAGAFFESDEIPALMQQQFLEVCKFIFKKLCIWYSNCYKQLKQNCFSYEILVQKGSFVSYKRSLKNFWA